VLADTAMKLMFGPQSAHDASQVLAETVRRLTALLSTLTPDRSIYEGAIKFVNGKQPRYHVGQDTDAGILMHSLSITNTLEEQSNLGNPKTTCQEGHNRGSLLCGPVPSKVFFPMFH